MNLSKRDLNALMPALTTKFGRLLQILTIGAEKSASANHNETIN